jgi:hypothetical protein
MNNNTVLLCYDDKEKALAEELEKCIDGMFDKKINVIPCGNPSDSKDKSVWKERLEAAFKSEKALIFVLCSPFSVGQSWVNFISGAVTIKIEKENDKNKDNKTVHEKKLPKIIPICHSGQKSKDLPHYLLSRQAMDVQEPSFIDALISILVKELSDNTGDRENNKLKSLDKDDKESILNRLRNISYSVNSKNNDKEPTVTEYFNVTLQREGEIIKITPTLFPEKISSLSEEARLELISKMHSFLARKDENPINAVVAIGVQNCLYDEKSKSFYIGLMRQLEVDSAFKSYCSPTGIFETSYILQQELPTKEKLDGIDHGFKNEYVESGSPLYEIIKKRAEAMGHKLWNLELSGGETIATIFINSTEPVPRLEIGVWKFIKISDFTALQKTTSPEGEPMSYWIWVKDGEIRYWTFFDEKRIPRFISGVNSKIKAPNPQLITTEQMREYYGRPEKYTPFATDDVLRVENVVKERFSAAARSLLSCF